MEVQNTPKSKGDWFLDGGTWRRKSTASRPQMKSESPTTTIHHEALTSTSLSTSPLKPRVLDKENATAPVHVSSNHDEAIETVASTPKADISSEQEEEEIPMSPVRIPLSNIRTIQTAFREQYPRVELYRDVLKVGKRANERQIRIAYFRRGRQVLAQQELTNQQNRSAASIADLSTRAKMQFQAVSMAYEILSTPATRALYDKVGLEGLVPYAYDEDEEDDALSVESAKSTPHMRGRTLGEQVESKKAAKARSRSVGRAGVRWSEEVEELVFKQEPGERTFKSNLDSKMRFANYEEWLENKNNNTINKKSKKPKKLIVLEASADAPKSQLVEHLKELDKAASAKNLVSKFLDDVEKSLDGFEDSFEGLIKYMSDGEEAEEQSVSVKATSSDVVAENEASVELTIGNQAEQEEEKKDNDDEEGDPLNDSNASNDSNVTENLIASLTKPPPIFPKEQSMKKPSLPNELLATPIKSNATKPKMEDTFKKETSTPRPSMDSFFAGLTAFDPFADDSQGGTAQDPELANAFPTEQNPVVVEPSPAHVAIPTDESNKPSSSDSVSTMTASVATLERNVLPRPAPRTTATGQSLGRVPEVTVEEDSGSLPAATDATNKTEPLNTTIETDPDPFSGLDSQASTRAPAALPGSCPAASSAGIDTDFFSHLAAYVQNLATDMATWSSEVGAQLESTNKLVLDSITLSEDDMTGMLAVLRKEIDENSESISDITRAATY